MKTCINFHLKSNIICLINILLIVSCTTKPGDIVGETTITKWQKDKKAALSITYDDGTINQFTVARPIMNTLNLPGTFYVITGKVKGSGKGKFIGRPFSEIIAETVSEKTNATNFFERASAIGFIGNGVAINYHSDAGSLFESGKLTEAYKLIDQGYEEFSKGELKFSDEVIFHDNKALDSTTWANYKSYTKEGHEIASHTVTHPRLAVLDVVNLMYELEQSKKDIEHYLGASYTFSAECPYGTEDERVMEYAQRVYPALRNRMPEQYLEELNRASALDPTSSTKEYVQWQRGALTNTSMDLMKSWVDTSLTSSNIWLVLVFHGVNGIGWEPKTGAELETYFKYIKAKESKLWIATFADVSKYIKERKNTKISSKIEGNAIALHVSTDLDLEIYNIPITIKTYVPKAWKSANLKKQGTASKYKVLDIQKDALGNFVLFDVLPFNGKLLLVGE